MIAKIFLHKGTISNASKSCEKFNFNLTIEGSSIKSIVKGLEINIHKDQLRRMFEIPSQGVSYIYEVSIKFKISNSPLSLSPSL